MKNKNLKNKKSRRSNYKREINRSLPVNPTALQIANHKLCKQILSYKLDNRLSREQVAEKIQLSKVEVEDILFCEIEKFTLDRLVDYTERLFSRNGINAIVKSKKDSLHASVV